ncbi:MAG: hypothetical protein EOO61_15885, partial [Hymenobacter sp.]
MSDSIPDAVTPAGSSKKDMRKNVFISVGAHSMLNKAAKKLGVSNVEYASAAIAYFATNGLDPCSQETQGLITVQGKVSETSLEVRKQNADIGNRIVAIIRTWEANQYKFMQMQHGSLLGYLENIETNILNQLVALEGQVLAPMLEQLVRAGVETHMNRIMTEILLLRSKDAKFTTEELRNSTADYDGQLDRRLVSE